MLSLPFPPLCSSLSPLSPQLLLLLSLFHSVNFPPADLPPPPQSTVVAAVMSPRFTEQATLHNYQVDEVINLTRVDNVTDEKWRFLFFHPRASMSLEDGAGSIILPVEQKEMKEMVFSPPSSQLYTLHIRNLPAKLPQSRSQLPMKFKITQAVCISFVEVGQEANSSGKGRFWFLINESKSWKCLQELITNSIKLLITFSSVLAINHLHSKWGRMP